jgi:hypothetical protein
LRLLCVILVFLSPPEPLETHTLTPTRTTMLAAVLTLQHVVFLEVGIDPVAIICDGDCRLPN